ncbi:MAG: MmgE/PrpD family protein [Burkholderiales bacterium]|nr:MmgE/PrpD family protein [Burkholderiales bacterium]
MSFATELSNKINELQYDILPADAVHWAKIGILDTVGVTVAGAHEPAARIVLGVSGSASGPALVFGHARRIGALDAALVNGTASHALDFDDCNNTLGGHPSAPILPALFALADETGATGKDFIAAYVAGFETECKLSMVVNFHQYTKGWHPTTTIGVFGAAAACAHLLRLPVEGTATALSIAASLAAGVKSNFGTMTKPLHVGHCARSGLFAALLARDGFTAGSLAFEHKQGYFEVFNGAGNYDASKAIPAWANPLDITRPGIAIKSYPCCGSTHPAIDCMLELVQKHKLKPEQVARIDSWTHARRLEHTNRPDPQSDLDAKFSVQYTLARALKDRTVKLEHFEGTDWQDPTTRAILPKIHVAPYTTEQFPADNHFGAEVKITLTDGRVVSTKTDQALGRSVDKPLPADRLKDKFDNCAARALSADNVARLYAAIQDFENAKDVREVAALAAGMGGPKRVAA